MRGELSPPSPTPSNPVGGEMVLRRVQPECIRDHGNGTEVHGRRGNHRV